MKIPAAFLLLTASLSLTAQSKQPTAQQIIDQLRVKVGAEAPADTVDTVKAGDPNTPVTGIATTFIPTMSVLRRAVAAHKNLIITHEPTFYNHRDETKLFTNDPVYKEKLAYIQQNHLVLWRFHDTWHRHQPDGITTGWVRKAGWEKYQVPGQLGFYTFPQTTVAALAQSLQKTFGARIIRVVGDPNLRITKVALRLGASGLERQVALLERDDVEVEVAGEASEWETVEYVRDAMYQGRHKALILLGHATSEEAGMDWCADWLKTQFPGMSVEFIPAGEPYWLPSQPVTLK